MAPRRSQALPNRVWRPLLVLGGVPFFFPPPLAALVFAPAPAMIALWRGSFGSYDAITSGTLVRATPVMLTGLSVAIAFRAGVFNIGAEGQFLAGAAAATSLSILPVLGASYASSPLALVAGAIAGGASAGMAP